MYFNIDTAIPGPGAYMPPSTFAMNAKQITIKPRPADPKPYQIPGPTAYTPTRSGAQKACTIGVRYKAKRLSPAPGPLSYSVSPEHATKSAIIGYKCFREKKPEPRPSAQDYDPYPIKLQRETKIGERHDDKIKVTPGPAEYTVEVGKGRGGRIYERYYAPKPQNVNIGPGKYYHAPKFSEGGFTMYGRSKRYWRLE